MKLLSGSLLGYRQTVKGHYIAHKQNNRCYHRTSAYLHVTINVQR
jgi:hypothetical protein